MARCAFAAIVVTGLITYQFDRINRIFRIRYL